jgi:hypothetical protein
MVERHIEKIILAVCVLILVYAVFHWGVSSPLVIEVITGSRGGVEPASPDQVDALLQKAAVDIENKSMVERSSPPGPVPDYAGELAQLRSPSVPSLQIVVSSPPPPPEGVTPPGGSVAKAGLKEIEAIIPKPGKPQVMVDREFTQKDPEPVDVLASHVVATFSWGDLVKGLDEALTKTAIIPEVVVVRVEARIRERRLDGDWGPERVVTMTRIPQTDRDGTEIAIPTVPEFDGNNLDEVTGAISELKEQQWQESILQPDYWSIWWPTQEWNTWVIHLPTNPISEKIEKEREAEEEAERAPARPTRAPPPRRTGRVTRDRRTTRGRGMSSEEAEYAAMMQQEMAQQERFAAEMEARARREPGVRGRDARDPRGMSPRDRRAPRRDTSRTLTDVPPPKVPEVTTLQEQKEDGLLLFWLHHTELEGLKEYQYRVRLVFVNPLITYSGYVKNDDDAKQPVVASPWSDWSAPFSAPQMTEFFAVSPMGSRRAVRVEVFTRGRGQWVMKGFLVAEGEMIGGERSVRVPNLEDGTLESENMDFSTGAVAVDFDFSKTVMKGNIPVKTVEMVYMDAKGRLKTRVAAADKDSPRYKRLKEEVSRAKAAAQAAAGYGR